MIAKARDFQPVFKRDFSYKIFSRRPEIEMKRASSVPDINNRPQYSSVRYVMRRRLTKENEMEAPPKSIDEAINGSVISRKLDNLVKKDGTPNSL